MIHFPPSNFSAFGILDYKRVIAFKAARRAGKLQLELRTKIALLLSLSDSSDAPLDWSSVSTPAFRSKAKHGNALEAATKICRNRA